MLKIENLRIGNFIKNEVDCLLKITSITDNILTAIETVTFNPSGEVKTYKVSGDSKGVEKCNGIELDVSFMLSNFSPVNDISLFTDQGETPPLTKDKFLIDDNMMIERNYDNWRIKDHNDTPTFSFLHELQNIYFDLTGNELPIYHI